MYIMRSMCLVVKSCDHLLQSASLPSIRQSRPESAKLLRLKNAHGPFLSRSSVFWQPIQSIDETAQPIPPRMLQTPKENPTTTNLNAIYEDGAFRVLSPNRDREGAFSQVSILVERLPYGRGSGFFGISVVVNAEQRSRNSHSPELPRPAACKTVGRLTTMRS